MTAKFQRLSMVHPSQHSLMLHIVSRKHLVTDKLAQSQYIDRLSRHGHSSYKHKTFLRPPYVYNVDSSVNKIASLNRDAPLSYILWLSHMEPKCQKKSQTWALRAGYHNPCKISLGGGFISHDTESNYYKARLMTTHNRLPSWPSNEAWGR